jgi:hypothetical protein
VVFPVTGRQRYATIGAMEQPEQPALDAIDVALPIVWVGADELPVHFVNNFIVQVSSGEVFLTLGSVVPPPLVGSPEEQKDQADRLGAVTVKPVVRAAMTPARARELHSNLGQIIAIYDRLQDLPATEKEK